MFCDRELQISSNREVGLTISTGDRELVELTASNEGNDRYDNPSDSTGTGRGREGRQLIKTEPGTMTVMLNTPGVYVPPSPRQSCRVLNDRSVY